MTDRTGDSGQASARRRLIGIALMCGTLFCFACLDACAKYVNQFVHPIIGTWGRYVVSVFLITLFLNPIIEPKLLRTTRLGLQTVRSVLLLVSTVLNFAALQYLQLTESVSIQFMMPLLVALIAGPILGEWAGPKRLVAIGVGLFGVLIITRPGLGGMHPAAILSVISTVCYAFYNVTTRILARYDSSKTTLVYSGFAGVILLAPALPFFWSLPPTPLAWAAMLGAGFFGAIGHGLLIMAHARAPAPVLAPFIYTQILWSIALGYVLFGDLPDRWTLIGGSVVIASGLYLLLREAPRPPRPEAGASS